MDLLPNETFIARLQAIGVKRYHDKHIVHQRMNEGALNPGQIRGWVANRFCYQQAIPIKDAAIVSNCPIREVRRRWLHRISDHDGRAEGEGGIEAWLRLGEACGLTRDELFDGRHILPGVRFAVDAYVQFARTRPWPIAIASSLTELFAPDLMSARLAAFEKYYTWVKPSGFDYFRGRLTQAKVDSGEGLELTLRYCDTRALQEEAIAALSFKCDVLSSMMDTVAVAYKIGDPISGASIVSATDPIPPDSRPQLSARARTQTDKVTGKPLVVYPEGVLVLNPTGEKILALCDGNRTFQRIVAELAARFNAPPDIIAREASTFLQRLRERNLLSLDGAASAGDKP